MPELQIGFFSNVSNMSKKFCSNLGFGSTNLGYQTHFTMKKITEKLTYIIVSRTN